MACHKFLGDVETEREKAEVAASVLSWSVRRAPVWGEVGVEEERDTNVWSQCQRGQDGTGGRKGECCPSFFAIMREKRKKRVDTDDEKLEDGKKRSWSQLCTGTGGKGIR